VGSVISQYVGFATSELRLPIAFGVLLIIPADQAERPLRAAAGAPGMRIFPRPGSSSSPRRPSSSHAPVPDQRLSPGIADRASRSTSSRSSAEHPHGYTGQISIGHGAFMAIGGYVTAIMSHDHHTNLIATLPLAFAITFACGVLVGIPALRLSGVYLALATFALAVSVPQFPLKFSKFTGGSNGIQTSETPTHIWL